MIDWITWAKPAGSLFTGVMSFYDRVVGKPPTADFAPGEYGVVLRLKNERTESVIIERVDAAPPLLSFSTGTETDDIVRAVVHQRTGTVEGALTVLKVDEEKQLQVITFDPFKDTPDDHKIKVTLQWRASSRSLRSRRKISKTITVNDVKDLHAESDRRRLRPRWREGRQ